MKSALLAAAIALGGVGLYAWAETPTRFSGIVVHVVDGDTIHVNGWKIRIWGIDSPEMSTSAGWAAKQAMIGLANGKFVNCLDMGRDRYHRTVAQCFLGKLDLAEEMVRQGHARDWPKYSNGYYANVGSTK